MHGQYEKPLILFAGLFLKDVPTNISSELIKAALAFIEKACKTKENRKKSVYKNANGLKVFADNLKRVLDHK